MPVMNSLSRSQLIDAIEARHSVRQYDGARAVEPDKLKEISQAIDCFNNQSTSLSFRLVKNEPRAFGGKWASYGNFQGVNNYIVVSGDKLKSTDVLCGEKGEELVLLLQHLGLSSCWVGLTYKKIDGAFEIPDGHNIRCLIAFGYAVDPNGRKHKIKTPQQVSNVESDSPHWFKEGVRLALLAPTAVNQQKFYFELTAGNEVNAYARFSLIGYSRIDLGIAICHFRIGADNTELKINIR